MVKQEINFLNKAGKWYKKRWGKIIMLAASLLVVFLPFYIFQLYHTYQDFRSGGLITVGELEKQAPYSMAGLVDALSPQLGNPEAKIVIVEFGDFNCPRTKVVYPILRDLLQKYGDKIKLYWRNFPVIAEDSASLALGAVCAAQQDAFWSFHDYLFQNQGKVKVNKLVAAAENLGLDPIKFQSCLDNPLTQAQVKKDYYAAKMSEVEGTPTFFVNGYKLQGAVPLEVWEQVIDKFLRVYEKDVGN